MLLKKKVILKGFSRTVAPLRQDLILSIVAHVKILAAIDVMFSAPARIFRRKKVFAIETFRFDFGLA